MKRGYKALLEEANAQIEAVTAAQAAGLQSDDVVLVDIRDVRELQREGRVPGAIHAPAIKLSGFSIGCLLQICMHYGAK